MKRTLCIILTILCLSSLFTITAFANENVSVYVNGEYLETDQPAIIYQGRTMVPLRAICESLACEVSWDGNSQSALIENEVTMVAVQINNYILTKKDRTVDGGITKTVAIDVPPMIINSRTLVPARAIAEAINAEVQWNGATNRVDITMEYDVIGDFHNGYAGVSKNGKFGYINENREVVIPLIYDNNAWHHKFDENGYVIVRKNGDEGIVDENHNIIVPIKYGIEDFNEDIGMYVANRNGTYGCFDEEGEIIVPFEYDMISTFSVERAPVKVGKKTDYGLMLYGYVGLDGDEIVAPYQENSDGTVRYGFCSAGDFSEGRAMVSYASNGSWGYIDKSGAYIIEERYQDAGDFSEGLAYVKHGGYYGYIDKYGNKVIDFVYDDAREFSDGLAAVESEGKWGFINEDGDVIIPFEYDDGYKFKQGLARVENNGYYGFIDTNNNIIIPCIYDSADFYFENGTVEVEKNGMVYEMDLNGNILREW